MSIFRPLLDCLHLKKLVIAEIEERVYTVLVKKSINWKSLHWIL